MEWCNVEMICRPCFMFLFRHDWTMLNWAMSHASRLQDLVDKMNYTRAVHHCHVVYHFENEARWLQNCPSMRSAISPSNTGRVDYQSPGRRQSSTSSARASILGLTIHGRIKLTCQNFDNVVQSVYYQSNKRHSGYSVGCNGFLQGVKDG